MAKVMLKLENLTKFFGRFKALDSVSLEIQEGEVFALLGPSGCGKTTTLRLIAGLESADDGSILLQDRTLVSVEDGIFVPPHKRDFGMVFQSYAIWPHMTVFENVAFPMKVRRTSGKEIRERVARALELVGLAGLESRQGTHLSGGQQQRVAVARALVYEPSVLLLDEPFSNLDAQLRRQMRVQLKYLLNELNITAVFVTHDQVEALSLSDRIAVMNAGQVEQVGSPRQLYERPGTSFVRDFVGSTMLLKGIVDDDSPTGHVSVRFSGIPDSTFFAPLSSESVLNPGSEVFVAIRPEDVQLSPRALRPAGAGSLPGTVEALLFVGDRHECHVRLGSDTTVLLHVPRSTSLRQGEPVWLSLTDECVSIWPA